MLKHADIWAGIDALARAHGYSASGLARASGLDATAFNPSKRIGPDGRPRWPSTESVAKVLAATGASFAEFVALVDQRTGPPQQLIPVIGYAQAGEEGFFDDAGFPTGSGWDEVAFPDVADATLYALEVSGSSMEPVYRDGTRIIVSPDATDVRRGDRVVVRTRDGEVMAKEFRRRTATRVELVSLNPEHEDRVIPLVEVDWMHRIIWASQ